jgi:hypothetical protein
VGDAAISRDSLGTLAFLGRLARDGRAVWTTPRGAPARADVIERCTREGWVKITERANGRRVADITDAGRRALEAAP